MHGHRVVGVCENKGEVADLSRRYMGAFWGRITPELAEFLLSEETPDAPRWLREIEEELEN